MIGTQQQFNGVPVVVVVTDYTLVGFAFLGFIQASLSIVHGLHDRSPALIILVDADTQVDLLFARVFAVSSHQTQNRVFG